MSTDRTPTRDVVAAEPLPGFQVRVTFDDGVVGVVDLSDLVGKGVFARWRERPSEFFQVSVDAEAGTLVWPGGLDVAPDRLYHDALEAALRSS